MIKGLDADNLTYAFAGIIIVFGAIVHTGLEFKTARAKNVTFTWVDFMILIFASIFAGLMFAIFATWLSDNATHFLLSAGTGAFLGVAGLNRVCDIVLEVLTRGRNAK